MNGSLLLVLALLALASAVPRNAQVEGRGLNVLNKKPPTKPTTTTTTTTTTTSAPVTTTEAVTLPPFRGDYELVGGLAYYKIHQTSKVWAEAWKTCKSEGAHLLVLRSPEEYNALYQWGKVADMPVNVHYGAHHRYVSHEFVTVFDEPLENTGYNVWVYDISDEIKYNNKDFPLIVIDISISWNEKGLRMVSDRPVGGWVEADYPFVCKQEL